MNTTNNKQLATAISDAEAELTLTQIIINTCGRQKQPRAYKLQQTYNQFIYALADSALLHAITLHCEQYETPPTPEQVQNMAKQIYKDLIAPPVWSWAENLSSNLKARSISRAQTLQILAALGIKEKFDLRGLKYTHPETPAHTYTTAGTEPTPTN